jgi:uncharacterized protein YqkB
MLKSIPKSSITKRKFQVYKLWNNLTDESYAVELISGSNSLYRSIRSKYYSNLDGNAFTTFGSFNNIAELNQERQLSDTIYVFDIDRDKFGEAIKKKSVNLSVGGSTYVDDGFGRIVNPIPTYSFVEFDMETGILTISQNTIRYELDVLTFDLQNGGIVILDDGIGETYYVVSIDAETELIVFTKQLDFQSIPISTLAYGNVFYSDGIIVINSELNLSSYQLQYRSTQTIYETEVLVSVKAGEFNYSQNPSAVEVRLSGSYDFETTPIFNTSPAKTVKIKEVLDINQRRWFSGSVNPSVSGSWDDYYNSSSIDPTGSYLAPFITTIGLYDDNGDMVAIAKLPQPIKNLPDYDLNFLIRFDT